MASHSTLGPTANTELTTNNTGAVLLSERVEGRKVIYRYLKIVLLAVIALRVIASVLSGAGQNWDFVNFFNTGSRILHGQNEELYSTDAPIAGKPAPGNGTMFYTGFPLSAYLFAPLGAFSPRLALLAFKMICALSFALALVTLYGYFRELLCPGWRFDQALSLYLLLVLFFEPFWFAFVVGGQSTPLAFLALAFFARSYTADRPWASALYLSIAVLIKPFLALTAAFLILTRDWLFIKRLAFFFIIELAFSCALFGVERHVEWVHIVLQEGSRWAVPWSKNCAVLGFIGNFWLYGANLQIGLTPAPSILGGIQVVFKIALAALFIWLLTRVRGANLEAHEKRRHYVTLAIVLPLLFATVVWAHYLAFLFIPILLLVAKYNRLPLGAKVLTLLILFSTVRANWGPLTWYFHRSLTVDTFTEIVAVGLFGSGVLILTLILLVVYNRELIHSQFGPKLSAT